MVITFLGTGTSSGVPRVGCKCPVCHSADSFDKRLRTSALIDTGTERILIDCGPDFRQQMLSYGKSDIDALLVTHSHYDHLGGLDDLRPFCHRNGGFPIYCSADVSTDIHTRMPYCFGELHYPNSPTFDIHIIDDNPFKTNRTEVIPLPVMHTPNLRIFGYRIGALSYITDCKEMPGHTLALLRGTDTLVINALRHEEHPSHMNLQQAIDVINAVKPRRALLTHISHQMGLHSEFRRMLPLGIEPAHDGLTVEI